ncbi:hypothetical protein, partial [Roseiarcus sp.]|uniref:hypothetical protein n=1 Tax=Roseiarcus sp. TaxID=1969460 RepID=UPI003D10794F
AVSLLRQYHKEFSQTRSLLKPLLERMGHLSPVCDSSRMIARRASLRDARRKINFRTAGRNDLQSFKSLRNARQPADLLKFLAHSAEPPPVVTAGCSVEPKPRT